MSEKIYDVVLRDVNKIYPNGFHAVYDFNINIGLTMHVMANPTFTREIEYERPNGRPEFIEDFESRWYSWGGELGVNFYDDEFGIGLGYSISSLELKTKIDIRRRAVTADRFIHGIFIKLYFGI